MILRRFFKKFLFISVLFTCFLGVSFGDEVGAKIVERNREIKEKREELDLIIQEKGYQSKEYKKASEKLSKLRDDREKLVESLPEGSGLRYKIRRNIANDRKAAERETEALESYKEEVADRPLTKKEKAEIQKQKDLENLKSEKTPVSKDEQAVEESVEDKELSGDVQMEEEEIEEEGQQ